MVQPTENVPSAKRIEHFREWAKLASIGIMILALFAFGLEKDEATHRLKPKWEEVPAILVVFVLVELGVELVSIAKDTIDAAERLADEAHTLTTDVTSAQNELQRAGLALTNSRTDLDNIRAKAQETNDELLDIARNLAEAEKSGIWAAVEIFQEATGMHKPDFWNALATFVRSWTVQEQEGLEHDTCFIPALLTSFVGSEPGESSGTVRANRQGVSCITADSIFSSVSTRWLADVIAKSRSERREERVVVWAVTTLMPVEFAVPFLWWGKYDHAAATPSRVREFENFVSEVIESCKSESVAEYRRITLFKSDGLEHCFPETWRLDSGASEAKAESTDVPLRKIRADLLQESLDSWFIWDPRVAGRKDKDALWVKTLGLISELVPDKYKARIDKALNLFKWESLGVKAQDVAATRKARILPALKDTDNSYLLRMYYVEQDYAKDHRYQLGESTDGRYGLCCVENSLTRETINKKEISSQYAELLNEISASFKLGELLKTLGWLSLREWYIKNLHREHEQTPAVWLKLKDEKSVDFLRLTWDDFRWSTLDLLLIGTTTEQAMANKEQPKWHGAAIANLQLDSPECVMKLITEQTALRDIERGVEALVSGELTHGTWASFPDPATP